jgi:hypothetical protein
MPISGPHITTLANGTVRYTPKDCAPIDFIETRDGTFYHAQTPAAVVETLEKARQAGKLIRVFYGDPLSGKDWLEENDVKGFLKRSMGPLKVPLLVVRGADGGGALLDHCVVRIQISGRDAYRHPLYHQAALEALPSDMPSHPFGVFVEGKNHANFRTHTQREAYTSFIRGEPSRLKHEAAPAL